MQKILIDRSIHQQQFFFDETKLMYGIWFLSTSKADPRSELLRFSQPSSSSIKLQRAAV